MAFRYHTERIDATKVQRTPAGMVRVDATVAKAGVYAYTNPDGTITREYLPAEEIARADSLASLEDVAVTNRHPRNMVDPSTWGSVSIGHARNGRADGEGKDAAALATLVIAKADAQNKIGGNGPDGLVEVSRGVTVRVDPTPGVTPWGEKYDAVQRDVVYNHIAVGPRGWNRQGPDVAMRLDSNGDEARNDDYGSASAHDCCENCKSKMDGHGVGRADAHLPWDECMAKAMKEYGDKETAEKVCGSIKAKNDGPQGSKGNDMLKYDGKEFKTDAELAAYIDSVKAPAEAAKGAAAAEKARADAAQARLDAIETERKQAARAALEKQAAGVLGVARLDSAETDRAIRVKVLGKLLPELKCDGQSDDYVTAAYDAALLAAPPAVGENRQDDLVRKLYGVRPDGTKPEAETQERADARDAFIEREGRRYKQPLSLSKSA